MIKMKINEEEAWKILMAIEPEEDENDEVTLRLRDRIIKEFPLIGKKLKYQKWRDYLWEVGAEEDERVIEARKELEKFKEEFGLSDNQFKQTNFYIALDNLMSIKGVVVKELLKE